MVTTGNAVNHTLNNQPDVDAEFYFVHGRRERTRQFGQRRHFFS